MSQISSLILQTALRNDVDKVYYLQEIGKELENLFIYQLLFVHGEGKQIVEVTILQEGVFMDSHRIWEFLCSRLDFSPLIDVRILGERDRGAFRVKDCATLQAELCTLNVFDVL